MSNLSHDSRRSGAYNYHQNYRSRYCLKDIKNSCQPNRNFGMNMGLHVNQAFPHYDQIELSTNDIRTSIYNTQREFPKNQGNHEQRFCYEQLNQPIQNQLSIQRNNISISPMPCPPSLWQRNPGRRIEHQDYQSRPESVRMFKTAPSFNGIKKQHDIDEVVDKYSFSSIKPSHSISPQKRSVRPYDHQRGKENNPLGDTNDIQSKDFSSRKDMQENSKSPPNPCSKDELKNNIELDAASILCSLSKVLGDEYKNTSIPRQKTWVSNLKSSEQNISEKGKTFFPTRLSMPNDDTELNSLHCFVRSELLEIFVLSENQGQENTPLEKTSTTEMIYFNNKNASQQPTDNPVSTKTSKYSRIGLRCVHCSHTYPRPVVDETGTTVLDPQTIITNFNAPMAAIYPKSLSDLYRLVCTWQRVHFLKCRHVPPSVRNVYKDLKNNDKSRGKTKFWVSSAMQLGMVNDENVGGFIRFRNDAISIRSTNESNKY